jgi:hypothetical protein
VCYYLALALAHDDAGAISDLKHKFMQFGHILQHKFGPRGVFDDEVHGTIGELLPVASQHVCLLGLGAWELDGVGLCLHLRGYKLIIKLSRC